MPAIKLVTAIMAPRERCFDLSRSIDLHMTSTEGTGERAIAGVTSGLIGPGERVTWRAKHLGVWQELTSEITIYDRPARFRDSMVRGAAARFDHDHFFEQQGPLCVITEVFDYASPLGPLGSVADTLFLEAYMRGFLARRNEVIKRVAEGDGWQRFVR